MTYEIFLGISLVVSVITVMLAALVSGKKIHCGKLNAITILVIGVFVAIFLLNYPIHAQYEGATVAESVLFSVLNTMQVFGMNKDYEWIGPQIAQLSDGFWQEAGRVYAGALFLMAPLLLIGFILSVFREFVTKLKFRVTQNHRDTYIFSQLNKESIETAQDIYANDKKALIVFCDVCTDGEDVEDNILADAEDILALMFEDSIVDVTAKQFRHRENDKATYFFLMAEQEDRNIEEALVLINKYREYHNIYMYVLAQSDVSEALLDSADKGNIELTRVNQTRSMVYWHIYKNSIFANARQEGDHKVISYLIVGTGVIGMEMLKAVIWCGQMIGYELEIHVVDDSGDLEEKLKVLLPEIMARNGIYEEGECYYRISVHDNMDVNHYGFLNMAEKLKPTHILVALGDDMLNINTAMKLRMISERISNRPEIYAVVQSEGLNSILKDNALANCRGQSYEIQCIGNRASLYRLKSLTNPKLYQMGLLVHQAYGGEESVYKNVEYNRRSSMVTAIHAVHKIKQGLDMESEETACLEHKRWNAYIRTEGYCLSNVRNDLAKQHTDLIPYEELSEEKKQHDRKILKYLKEKYEEGVLD